MQERRRYYSIRMRASKGGSHEHGGKHISGGELLSTYSDLKKHAVNALLEKDNKTKRKGRSKHFFPFVWFRVSLNPKFKEINSSLLLVSILYQNGLEKLSLQPVLFSNN
ncbi:MAG: 6-carboxyhexanoate--CoA ligase [Bacillota bacterium]